MKFEASVSKQNRTLKQAGSFKVKKRAVKEGRLIILKSTIKPGRNRIPGFLFFRRFLNGVPFPFF